MRMALFSSKNEIRPPFDRKLSKLTLTIRNKSHAARPFTLPHVTRSASLAEPKNSYRICAFGRPDSLNTPTMSRMKPSGPQI